MKLDREITRADVSGALVGLQLHLWKADYEASLKLLEKKDLQYILSKNATKRTYG